MTHTLDIALTQARVEFFRATLRVRAVETGDAPVWWIERVCDSAGLPPSLDTARRAMRRPEHGRPLRILRNWASSTRIGWELGGLYWRILSPAESWHAPFQTFRIEFAERNPVRSAPLAILRGDGERRCFVTKLPLRNFARCPF